MIGLIHQDPPVAGQSRELARLSDEALLSLVATSDEDALAELYDRFGGIAYGLALRILRDEALAQDAVQEAFLSVWRTADRFLAERLDQPLGTIKSRMFTGLARLRELLAQAGLEESFSN